MAGKEERKIIEQLRKLGRAIKFPWKLRSKSNKVWQKVKEERRTEKQ